jgi:hypothetical protein
MNTKGGRSIFLATTLCLSVLTAYAATPKGAVVQNFVVNGKEIKVTVLNQSEQPINGYTVRIEMTLRSGNQTFSEETEDVGPRGKNLLAHESIVKTYDLGVIDVAVVKPRIVVVIYANGTAESERKETLDQILSVRQKAVRDLKLTPDEIKTYVNVRRLP